MSVPRLRAPKEHGAILAVPPLDQVPALLLDNQRTLEASPLADLRALARREILAASRRYHDEAGQPIAADATGPWLAAGHQPELFHPGVWFKNFALYQLAQTHHGTALNLVIDTDTPKPALLHAPVGGHIARVPFDRSSLDWAYEERVVEDEQTFADLPERAKPLFAAWGFEPMLASFWREAMAHAKRTRLLGERLAAARRGIERRWGCLQREVPMSRVCQTEAFAYFACSILESLGEFRAAYNDTVRDYRAAHGIKSRSHPVPDLAADGDWLEAPFWAWRGGEGRRGKLFVKPSKDVWMLRVGGADWPTIPGADRADAVAAWRRLEARGYKIRSRALSTTMFARLCLADLFVHGIGGGIYDELTDRIIERFYAIPAPAFVVLSATLLLPLPSYPGAAAQSRERARRFRDLTYKPEMFADSTPATTPLMAAKREWIRRSVSTHAERVERFQRIRELNASLAPFVHAHIERAQTELAECQRRMQWHAIAARRDYAFCLYPEEMLREFYRSQLSPA